MVSLDGQLGSAPGRPFCSSVKGLHLSTPPRTCSPAHTASLERNHERSVPN